MSNHPIGEPVVTPRPGLTRRPATPQQPSSPPPPLTEAQRTAQSGLTEYERITLRLWGHDIQDDGKNDGSVLLKTLLNPEGSDNTAFHRSPSNLSIVFDHLIRDMRDDGQINGTSIRQDFGQIYQKVTGHDISQQLANAPKQAADLSFQELFRQQPDMRSREGLQQISRNTGLSVNEFLNISLWGHDAIDQKAPNTRNIDGSVLRPSLTDRNNLDFGFVNSSPGTKAYTQGLIDRDVRRSGRVTGEALNFDFVKIVEKIYGIPGQIIPS
jgi:hypothetical protein